jgi:RNA polymerase sigma-70 factor (ECF subfamily)
MEPTLEVFEAHRPLLFSIAYRMLGSAMEAEDMVQEAYLRYQATPAETIESPKAFLCAIVTRLCLDYLKSARVQRESYLGPWLPEPVYTGGSPASLVSERESISMAFLVVLESLTPVERAVFLLRDVFDYSYDEIAEIVEKSADNCRQIYHRAKGYLVKRRPRFESTPEDQQKLIAGFLQAIGEGDLESLTQILAEDAVLWADGGGKVNAARIPVQGRERLAGFLIKIHRKFGQFARTQITEVNGQMALVAWFEGQIASVFTFSMAEGQISEIRVVVNPEKLRHLTGQLK